MQVILLTEVKGLGGAGATVDVAPGYARNFLFPRRLAEPATAENLHRAEAVRAREAQHAARALERARELAARLQDQEVTIPAKAGDSGRLFGSVTAQDVAAALQKAYGATVDRRRIHLDEPLKTIGDHTLTIRLHPEVSTRITVRIQSA